MTRSRVVTRPMSEHSPTTSALTTHDNVGIDLEARRQRWPYHSTDKATVHRGDG